MSYYLAGIIIVSYSLHFGQGTRFLPMIVWDHLNPMLSGKCNWLTMPQIDRYDRVDFVCPTFKIAVNFLDGYSRPTQEMNENLFRRKWHGTEDELKSHIEHGTLDSFCDPKSSAVDFLYSCRNGKEGKGLGVTFKPHSLKQQNYKNGEIYLFFNNGDDGKVRTLNSKTKKCTMLFPVKVTKTAANKKHDMTYGKSCNPNANLCRKSIGLCVSTVFQQNRVTSPRTKRHHLLTSFKNLQNSSTPIQECETGSYSKNTILIVTIVILAILSTTFLLIIILMVSWPRKKVENEKEGMHIKVRV